MPHEIGMHRNLLGGHDTGIHHGHRVAAYIEIHRKRNLAPSTLPFLNWIKAPSGPVVVPVSSAPLAIDWKATSAVPPGASTVPDQLPSTSAATTADVESSNVTAIVFIFIFVTCPSLPHCEYKQ